MAPQQPTTTTPDPNSSNQFIFSPATTYERMTSGATRAIAKHLLTVSPPILATSTIHDNAAGTGIMTREILALPTSTSTPNSPRPTIFATDSSPAMIQHINSQISTDPSHWQGVTATVMPAESLTFDDDTFTHSFTNFGILFFTDAPAGASEIHRTLRPGGTALVTCWADLGFWAAWRATEARIRPGREPFEWPVREDWLDPRTVEGVMKSAGFEDVVVTQVESSRREVDVRTLAENLSVSFGMAVKGWSEGERERLVAVLMEEVVKVESWFVDEGRGEVGLRMLANVAVGRKGGGSS